MNIVNDLINKSVAAIEAIVKENPAVTHINLRRDDDQLVDVPLDQAVPTIKRHPSWRVVDGAYPKIALGKLGAPQKELPVILPKKPSEQVGTIENEPIFYGPHACEVCGETIVKGSKASGGHEFNAQHPTDIIYPNTHPDLTWVAHEHKKPTTPATPKTSRRGNTESDAKKK